MYGVRLDTHDRLVALVARAGMKQKVIAQRLEESEEWISRRMRGKTPILADEVSRLADVLGVPACALVDDAEFQRVVDGVLRAAPARATARAETATMAGMEEDRLHIDYFRDEMGLDDEAAIELRKLADLLRRRRESDGD